MLCQPCARGRRSMKKFWPFSSMSWKPFRLMTLAPRLTSWIVGGHLPCPLHSWGSQLRPCACLCRKAGLSKDRLIQKGLFEVIVRAASETHQGRPRHIHPTECAALVGFDPTIPLGDHVMLQLAALGQIASPLHSTWTLLVTWTICSLENGPLNRWIT